LHIKDAGETKESIDLSKYSTEDLHKLMVEKGFERKAQGTKAELRKSN